jgi:hypothetical protein
VIDDEVGDQIGAGTPGVGLGQGVRVIDVEVRDGIGAGIRASCWSAGQGVWWR